MHVTRRGVLGGAATAAALTLAPVRVVAQVIEDVFRIQDDPENPTNFTYDLFAWAGSGYLAFRDGEVDVARWGDDNPPVAEEEAADEGVVPVSLDLPTQIDIPLSLNLRTMAIETGTAVFLVGVMATTGGASILARNWPAAIMWGLAFVILIVGSLLGLGLEIFWLSLALVILLLMAGLLVRWAGV